MARIGYLYLRNGIWDGQTILPLSFVQQASRPEPTISGLPVTNPISYPDASDHHGLLWWTNGDGTLADVPTDAYWSRGLHDSYIIVIPSLDVVATRAGGDWAPGNNYEVMEPFITPIAQSVLLPTNQPPMVEAGVDQTIQLPVDTVSLDATVSDDGLPGGGVTTIWSVVSGPGTVVFGNEAAVDTTALFSAAGDYVLELNADDGALNANDTVSVTVQNLPDVELPTVVLDAPLEGSTVSGVVLVSATAGDNVAVASVSFAVGATPLGTLTSAPYEVNWDTTAYTNGGYPVTATATDTSGNIANTVVNVTVDNGVPVNQPPVVAAGVNQTIRLPVDTVSLDATVSDDGLPGGGVTTNWSVVSGPGSVVFGNEAAVDTTAMFSAAGDYVLELNADDGALNANDTVSVTVEAAPVLTVLTVTPSSVTIAVNASQAFNASGEDQYGDPIVVNPVWTASGGSIDATGFYVAGAVVGGYQVTATQGTVSGQATVSISDLTLPTTDYLQFDGVDDVFVVADDASLDITAAITLEAWIRPDTLSNSKAQDRVVNKTTDYELTVSTGDTGCHFGSNGDVQWRATIGGLNRRICGGVLTPGVWQHIAGTYDGNEVVLYVDGLAVASASRSGQIATNAEAVHLGNLANGSRAFDGAIDDVRIWDRALDAAEIATNRTTELTGTEPGLMGYYRLNEGTGQTGFDASPVGNDGVLGSTINVETNDPLWILQ